LEPAGAVTIRIAKERAIKPREILTPNQRRIGRVVRQKNPINAGAVYRLCEHYALR
jgi:hypothetical protein